MWDDQRVVDLLSGFNNLVAYMNGHNHAGNYGSTGGKHFLNLKGMVETPAQTAYAVVEVYPDRLEVKGGTGLRRVELSALDDRPGR